MQLETSEHSHTLTGPDARQQRRDAFRRFLASVLRRRLTDAEIAQLCSALKERSRRIEAEQALAEERTLREMVEAENAELAAQNAALKAEIATWLIGSDGDLRSRQLATENEELRAALRALQWPTTEAAPKA